MLNNGVIIINDASISRSCFQEGGEKIEMSMKVVNQKNGKDLDPDNQQAS